MSHVIKDLNTYLGDEHEFCIQSDNVTHCADEGLGNECLCEAGSTMHIGGKEVEVGVDTDADGVDDAVSFSPILNKDAEYFSKIVQEGNSTICHRD
jgi:hypothetical protein